jgi:hypothetical protein
MKQHQASPEMSKLAKCLPLILVMVAVAPSHEISLNVKMQSPGNFCGGIMYHRLHTAKIRQCQKKTFCIFKFCVHLPESVL